MTRKLLKVKDAVSSKDWSNVISLSNVVEAHHLI